MICVLVGMGWFLNRNSRPPLLATLVGGLLGFGYLVLFLVTNRGALYIGSDFEFTTDVTTMVEKPDTGNEYIYGAGAVLAAEARDKFYWGLRYAAQILVRPIPSSVWPNRRPTSGCPSLMYNAGTGDGFSEILGWERSKRIRSGCGG